ncbi:MAG TPA: GGDEF domain-containing protein [Pseudonocardiaceae bacterium]|nr:GGDEF domain-containing protein [Pseudonocardiaceae bacterium]
MSPRQFAAVAGTTGLLLAATLVTVVVGGADWSVAVTVDKLFQLGASLIATARFLWTARRSSGAERRWRLWMAAAMASLSIGMSAWIWGQLIIGVALPSSTLAPVGFIMVPVLTLFGVFTLVHDEPSGQHVQPQQRRGRLLQALDALIICGSLFVLVLVSVLESVFRAWPTTGPAMATVVAHPAAYLLLLAVIAVLTRTHSVIRQPPVLLIALAGIAQSTSGWVFAYLIGAGATRIPTVADIGFIACPALFALAAFAPFRPAIGHRPNAAVRDGRLWFGDYVTLAVPYLPLAVTCLFVVFSTATGDALSPLEVNVGLGVVGLVILRQLVTLLDNTRLLRQIGESQRQLEHQAYHDPLTGLANRTLFLARLADAVAVHDRGHRPLVLLFVDIDGFKTVNDNFGHGAGDAVLRTVAERLLMNVREGDLVARLGGDEFSVLLDGTNDSTGDHVQVSRRISQQLLDTLCAPQVVRGRDLCISASIGTVSLCVFDPDLTPDELLRRADEAMYAAKRRGKGAMVVYGDTTQVTDQRTATTR